MIADQIFVSREIANSSYKTVRTSEYPKRSMAATISRIAHTDVPVFLHN